jgi:ATP-dependent RNA helicase RhlE
MYNNKFTARRSSRFTMRFRNVGGARRIKSFDPTNVIGNPVVSAIPATKHEVTHEFSDFKIADSLKRNIAGRYKTPTPIQDQVIPHIIEGRDVIGIANTGTGKTAAFLIPLINKVLLDRSVRVLIMAPTRELAAQIRDEFIAFSEGLNIYCTLCIGGASMYRQVEGLRRNPNFVIGTPGRIKDLLMTRKLDLSNFRAVVLDEADHMVDIGFIHDVKYMISLLPRTRQSLFFSATIDGKVGEVLRAFVTNPVTVSVKTRDTAENVEQKTIKILDQGNKIEQLHTLVIQKEFEKVLVFGRTKHGVQKISDTLVKRGVKADAIHGNKNQGQRMRTLERFKRNEIQVLLATDVAARGLDIPNVSHVINFDLPESYDAYIHRIGRTGRADKKGIALTFV